jgi:hypothetical protein
MAKDRALREKLLNGKTLTLLDGKRVTIRPWSIDQRDDLIPVLAEIVVEIQKAGRETWNLAAPAFLAKYSKQTDALVQLSLGWSDAKMKKLTFEDSLQLTNAVIEICILRPDGGGPLGELLRLFALGIDTVEQVVGPALLEIAETDSKTRSRSSSHGVTRSEKSEAIPPN